ncbi:ribonuclease HI family protein [Alkaliphilus peptidifermentans]|uniref:Ribonuclease HI n=1 Tax=Alkaliphilus peptidifermentans DSM 18978 TaxID=1120976 RepID=A0A1G5BND3_9FIRM|nr:ribonuclease HI family protein [Alkaliphilus peptidifermentans]SCX91692.1 ribonuclease HI [Alkaliphilus peptidifermentans DSM 18978]
MKAIIYTDGGSRGNPGEAGIGIAIEDEQGNIIKEISQYIGKQTNNVAEYKALSRGLEVALDMGVKDIVCYLDSELVVKQIKGEYKVKNEGLIPIYNMIMPLINKFEAFDIKHIRREYNKKADKLANDAMDNK